MKAAIVLCVMALSMAVECYEMKNWWETMSLYQIYPRSFRDSNDDGVGDLKGITTKLHHLVESNVDAFWLSPIYPSPMVDSGYDISDYVTIDPVFGTLKDFNDLVSTARELNLKVIMDFVPNHSSDQHQWFKYSLQNIQPYANYYVWHPGRTLSNGTVVAPNNWVSAFGGSAWTWRKERQAFYLHQFAKEQPDLNYANENVVREMQEIMRFWLDRGVDGFRVDAVPHLFEDNRFLDEPLTGTTSDPNNYGYTEKVYTQHQPATYEMVRRWRAVLDEYVGKVMLIEAYANISMTMKYYQYGATFPFNFGMITDLHQSMDANDVMTFITKWMTNMPAGATPNWVAGNHDKSRLVTRFGPERARLITVLTFLLPGVGVTYNGEEIGMEDTFISWADTKDPQGCIAGRTHYVEKSRDPARTPYQWDDSESAGFSGNLSTWLPVNKNYKTVNLMEEKRIDNSYYSLYRAVSLLKKTMIVQYGEMITKQLSKWVMVLGRETVQDGSVYVILNFGVVEETVDLSVIDIVSGQLNFYYATVDVDFCSGAVVSDVKTIKVPALGAIILIKPKAPSSS